MRLVFGPGPGGGRRAPVNPFAPKPYSPYPRTLTEAKHREAPHSRASQRRLALAHCSFGRWRARAARGRQRRWVEVASFGCLAFREFRKVSHFLNSLFLFFIFHSFLRGGGVVQGLGSGGVGYIESSQSYRVEYGHWWGADVTSFEFGFADVWFPLPMLRSQPAS